MAFSVRRDYRKKLTRRGNYWIARRQAFSRSEGLCQSCGVQRAEEAHHWAFTNYPSGDQVTGNDLIAVCKTCHYMITALRRLIRTCIDRSQLEDELELAIFDFWEDIYDKSIEGSNSQNESISIICCKCGHRFPIPLAELTSQDMVECPSCTVPIVCDITDSQAWNLLRLSLHNSVDAFLRD